MRVGMTPGVSWTDLSLFTSSFRRRLDGESKYFPMTLCRESQLFSGFGRPNCCCRTGDSHDFFGGPVPRIFRFVDILGCELHTIRDPQDELPIPQTWQV